jgi:hypothetical protein
MLRFILHFVVFASFLLQARASILKIGRDSDGLTYENKMMAQENINLVSIYEKGNFLGAYTNLVIDTPSISSYLVFLVNGGMALSIETSGSKNHYSILVPITIIGGELYVECLYKRVYDTVDHSILVGSVCEMKKLREFDVLAAVNEDGLFAYSINHRWLRGLRRKNCTNVAGLEIGRYRVVRCNHGDPTSTKQNEIIVFDSKMKVLFSMMGYELIPDKSRSGFLMEADLKDGVLIFKGDFECYTGKAVCRTQ